MVEIDTLFQTNTAKKLYPFNRTYYSLYKGAPPSPGAKNALQIMSLAAYASEIDKYSRQISSQNSNGKTTYFKRKVQVCFAAIHSIQKVAENHI